MRCGPGSSAKTGAPSCPRAPSLRSWRRSRTSRFPGLGFRGPEHSRRAWVIGTGLDVWELVELYKGKGRGRLISEHNVSERQLDLALSYYEVYPREIEGALEENVRSPEEWHEISPSVIPAPE